MITVRSRDNNKIPFKESNISLFSSVVVHSYVPQATKYNMFH